MHFTILTRSKGIDYAAIWLTSIPRETTKFGYNCFKISDPVGKIKESP